MSYMGITMEPLIRHPELQHFRELLFYESLAAEYLVEAIVISTFQTIFVHTVFVLLELLSSSQHVFPNFRCRYL